MTASRPRAVIFDCDGVLVQHNRLDFGPLTARMSASPDRSVLRALLSDGTDDGFVARAQALDAALPEAWLRREFHRIVAGLAAESRLVPGILAVLDALDDSKIPYAVASNGPLLKVQVSLGQHDGLVTRFGRHMHSGLTRRVTKPSPKFFLRPARQLGVRPRHCAVVDDGLHGIVAAVSAGMRALCYAGEGKSPPLAEEGVALAEYKITLFRDMTQLPQLLGL